MGLPAFHAQLPDVEDLLAERGLDISYETVRSWVLKFGPVIARQVKGYETGAGDFTFRLSRRSLKSGLKRRAGDL